jgi:hypothetical protein
MKRCPQCHTTYPDDSLSYCLEDGSSLMNVASGPADPAATIIMEPRITVPQPHGQFRPTAMPPQPFVSQPASWPPAGVPHTLHPTRAGGGAAITSLVLAISAFLLLGFCVISGATGVDERLIGGIFILSALLALTGAILGIVATSKSNKDQSPHNARAMSLVGLALNGLYLLITVVFLILGAVATS